MWCNKWLFNVNLPTFHFINNSFANIWLVLKIGNDNFMWEYDIFEVGVCLIFKCGAYNYVIFLFKHFA